MKKIKIVMFICGFALGLSYGYIQNNKQNAEINQLKSRVSVLEKYIEQDFDNNIRRI